MDTFFAMPSSLSPFSPVTKVLLDGPSLSILTAKPTIGISTPYVTTTPGGNVLIGNPLYGTRIITNPNALYYYDSGIGENPLAQYETAEDVRNRFLNNWLYDDFEDIIRMMKVDSNGRIKILSDDDAKKNDISKDTEDDLEKKSDYIKYEILSLAKVMKILKAFIVKNNLKFYDIPHNHHYVKKALGHYVMEKLRNKSA
jgi:hypothetical protein